MASYNYQWPNERAIKKTVGLYEIDGFSTQIAKVKSLSCKLDTISVNVVQSV